MDDEPVRAGLRLSTLALLIADDQLDARVEELTPNWGPQIQEYLDSVDIDHPAPWCAAFVYWCIEEACSVKQVANPADGVSLKGYVPSWVKYGRQEGWVVPDEEAGTGDLFCLYYDRRGRFGHIGFVREPPRESGLWTTIEGNSNEGGSREGTKVVSRRRDLATLPGTVFLRWSEG